MKKKELIVKLLLLACYLLPIVHAKLNSVRVDISGIYYIGMAVTAFSFFRFRDEVFNNWVLTIVLVLFPVNFLLICLYFFG
jgi:hypothetical protein